MLMHQIIKTMGKKAKLKQIRRIAQILPPMQTMVKKGEIVSGQVLKNTGVSEVQGKPIELNRSYRKFEAVKQPVNHNRKMKKLYNQYGINGVKAYYNGITQMAQKQSSIPQSIK